MPHRKVKISEVAEINPQRASDLKPTDLVSFVPMASVSETTLSITDPIDRPYSEVAKGFMTFLRGDILIAKITPCFENGKMAHAQNLPNLIGFGSTEFHVLRPMNFLEGAYLFHFLRAPYIRKSGETKMKGAAGQRRVPADFFAELEIPLPPLDEQRRIAEILDAADALRVKRREALAELDALLQSTFLDMFGDPVTNPKGWRIEKSCNMFFEKPKIGTTRPASGKGVLVVRVGEVGDTAIRFDKCSRVEIKNSDLETLLLKEGDIVLARAIGSKEQLGKASLFRGYKEPVVIDSHVMRLRPNPSICNSRWFFSIISSQQGKKMLQQKGGATAVQFNINAKQISDIDIPLPPLSLQRRFAAIVEGVERQKARMRAHGAELDALFASLQSRAFDGEL